MSRFAIWGQFNWGQANWTEWTPYGVSKSGSSSAGDFNVVKDLTGASKNSPFAVGQFFVTASYAWAVNGCV